MCCLLKHILVKNFLRHRKFPWKAQFYAILEIFSLYLRYVFILVPFLREIILIAVIHIFYIVHFVHICKPVFLLFPHYNNVF